MDAAQERKALEIVGQALAYVGAEQKAFIEKACDGDALLMERVWALCDSQSLELTHGSIKKIAEMVPGPSLLGQVIGPYQVDSILGQGGMGVLPAILKVCWSEYQRLYAGHRFTKLAYASWGLPFLKTRGFST